MAKHEIQYLKNLINIYTPFPNSFSDLNPRYKNGYFVIPLYGNQDSKVSLALKMDTLLSVQEGECTVQELIKKFMALKKSEQKFVAYNLSHELKIATLASFIALDNQDSNVYEIGPCLGFSSHLYSNIIKNQRISPSKPIYKLTAIESNKRFFQAAEKLLQMMDKDYIAKIEYVHGDGIEYLSNLVNNNDIVFASLAEPDVCEGIIDFSNSKKINFVLSYSERTNDEIKRRKGKSIDNMINPDVYQIYPFIDKEYSIYAHDMRRLGVFVLSANL